MRAKLILAVAALMMCGSVMAQQDTTVKKKGGFMKTLKRGVESTTGLRVSDEALFVYPGLGGWKCSVISCIGSLETDVVTITIGVIRLQDSPRYTGARCIITQAAITGGAKLPKLEKYSADPLYNFVPNQKIEVVLNKIYEVPPGSKTIDIKFYIDYLNPDLTFEARRIPILWE